MNIRRRSLAAPSPDTLGRRTPSPSTSSVSFQKKGGFAGTEERPSACDHMRCEFQVSSSCYFQNIRYLFNFQIYSCHRQFDKQHIRKSTGSSRTMAQGHWRQRYRCRSSSQDLFDQVENFLTDGHYHFPQSRHSEILPAFFQKGIFINIE